MPKRFSVWVGVLLVLASNVTTVVSSVHAEEPTSSSYKFSETSIGTGGMLQSSSANYQATSTTGDLGVGNSESSHYQIDSGRVTTPDPRLALMVNGSAELDTFSAAIPAMGTSSFTVLNYTSFGYVVNIIGSPLTHDSGSHSISPVAPNTFPDPPPYTESSTPGFEQFGINLAANAPPDAPESIGLNPAQDTFGFGVAAANYNTNGKFRYVSGDTIASAPKSSGVTSYTITYLVNVGALTPGGKYRSNQTIVVTGTY